MDYFHVGASLRAGIGTRPGVGLQHVYPFFLSVECFRVPLVLNDGKPPREAMAILPMLLGCPGLCEAHLDVEGRQADK